MDLSRTTTFVKSLGILELLAAAGLLLPAALNTAPTPVALNLTYLTLAAFVARGRFGPTPFTG
ncbi:hypothetical protein [Streptomyces niveiscabiei]|uniref:Uncharacterized protein n=1 Tax=Streptomyces niveiscabiei TaxID=164115 RepID=A0ABW9HZ57_9ACTN